MKNLYIIGLTALPLLLMTGACQNEELASADTSGNGQALTLRAAMGNYTTPQTRAQVELGNQNGTSEIFLWNEGDSFTLYDQADPIGASSTFTISGYSEASPAAEAAFVGENAFEEGASLTAIYPAQTEDVISTNLVATLTLPDVLMTDGTENDWKNYMSQRMYMHANATMAGENTALVFHHLCAMIRVSYTNATGTEQSISEVTLTGDGDYFGSVLKYGITDGTTSTTVSSPTMTLRFSSATVAPGTTADLYFLFFPGNDASAGTLSIRLDDRQVDMSLSELLTENFAAGKRYWFNTVETSDGLIWSKDLPGETITNLPLIQYIETSQRIEFIKDQNGFVNVAANKSIIDQVTAFGLTNTSAGITNLDGLEYFTNLEHINIWEQGITTLDVSKFTNLTYLDVQRNPLEKLDVSANTKLTFLDCSRTLITELDLTHNTELVHLSCSSCQLESLDLSQNTKLEELLADGSPNNINWPYYNLFTSLDLSHNTELRQVWVGENLNLASLNISNCTKLEELMCNETALTSLDVSNNTLLKRLWCGHTQISEIDISNNQELTEFECQESMITNINLSSNPALTILYLSNSEQLKEIDISHNPLLTNFSCNNTAITTLDLSNNPALTSVMCMQNALTTLDVSYNTELTELLCFDCNLTELDITNNPKLSSILCGRQSDATTGYSMDMTLYLTSDQKQNLWDLNMEYESDNEYVNAVVR